MPALPQSSTRFLLAARDLSEQAAREQMSEAQYAFSHPSQCWSYWGCKVVIIVGAVLAALLLLCIASCLISCVWDCLNCLSCGILNRIFCCSGGRHRGRRGYRHQSRGTAYPATAPAMANPPGQYPAYAPVQQPCAPVRR
ncbi:hypothetical protein PYCC9005_001866 [Savitreella phatthalungensis]